MKVQILSKGKVSEKDGYKLLVCRVQNGRSIGFMYRIVLPSGKHEDGQVLRRWEPAEQAGLKRFSALTRKKKSAPKLET